MWPQEPLFEERDPFQARRSYTGVGRLVYGLRGAPTGSEGFPGVTDTTLELRVWGRGTAWAHNIFNVERVCRHFVVSGGSSLILIVTDLLVEGSVTSVSPVK